MNPHGDNLNHDASEPRLPAELADQLRQCVEHRVFVPRETDNRMLTEAAAHLRQHARPAARRMGMRWHGPVAMAACLLIGLGVVVTTWKLDEVGDAMESSPALLVGDVNGDGMVDIVDAYLLARRGDELPDEFDLNGDGVVDHQDAQALAMRVVDLQRGVAG